MSESVRAGAYMENAIAELRRASQACWVEHSSYYFSLESVSNAVKGSLKMLDTKVDDLEANIQLVLTGQSKYTQTSWKMVAALQADGYNGQMAEMKASAFTFARVYDEIIIPTGETLAKKANDVTDGVQSSIPWLTVSLVALAVIFVARLFK